MKKERFSLLAASFIFCASGFLGCGHLHADDLTNHEKYLDNNTIKLAHRGHHHGPHGHHGLHGDHHGSHKRVKKVTKKKYAIKKGDDFKFVIKRGDYSLGIGGATHVSHFLKKNNSLLNANLPDQNEYFKNIIDLIINFSYGEKTYGHKAIEAYTKLRHKGIWGRNAVFADSDASSPSSIKLSNTVFGEHTHTNGKPLIWIKQGWLKFSLNAALGQKNAEKIHTAQLGWFPFELGRGIALGSSYGNNRETLGLYSYPEDKSAPGITIHGELVKDKLWYNLYYSKFEERDKSIRDTLNQIKANQLGRRSTPWRGVNKDDEVFAGSLKWKALTNHKHGTLELEPYVFYNEGSDQMVELLADTKTELGTIGIGLEHKYKQFEWGGEAALNFGDEILRAVDRNKTAIERITDPADNRGQQGALVEVFTHILDTGHALPMPPANPTPEQQYRKAVVNNTSRTASFTDVTKDSNRQPIPGSAFINASNRVRPSFKNRLRGWMGVIDCAYNFKNDMVDLTLAAAYGYASGDDNPHKKEENKSYKGFVGLHENYCGKRVKSIMLLDDRLIQTPSGIQVGDDQADKDFAFTDLQHFGVGATWRPLRYQHKKLKVNPNAMFFWKATGSKKFNLTTLSVSDEDASKFMGTEANLLLSFEPIPDFTVFGIFSLFFPGRYFSDVKGVPMDKDLFTILSKEGNDGLDPQTFRISDNTAYYMNLGIEYRF